MKKKDEAIKSKEIKEPKSGKIEMSVEAFEALVDKKINEKLSKDRQSVEAIKKEAVDEYKATLNEKKEEARANYISLYKQESLIEDDELCEKLISYQIRPETARGVITDSHKLLDKRGMYMVLNKSITHVKHSERFYTPPEKGGIKELTERAWAIKGALAGRTKAPKSNVGKNAL